MSDERDEGKDVEAEDEDFEGHSFGSEPENLGGNEPENLGGNEPENLGGNEPENFGG